jgi:hypothetical protein
MRDNDSKTLNEMYSLIRENEQEGANKQQVQQVAQQAAPQTAEASNEIISQIPKEKISQFLGEVQKLENLDPKAFQTALDALIKKYTTGDKEVQAESYIKEGALRQLRSRIAGLGGAKDQIFGARPGQEKRNYQSEKFQKRFEIFKRAMEKNLKELQLDLKTTNVAKADPKIMQSVVELEKQLATNELGGITPSKSRGQEIGHTIGKFAQDVGTAGTGGALLLALAPVSHTLGAAIATKAAIGALVAAGKKFVEKGELASAKEIAIGTAAGALGGALSFEIGKHIADAASGAHAHIGTHTQPQTPEFRYSQHLQMPAEPSHAAQAVTPHVAPPTDDQTLMDIIKHWKPGTHTQFGHTDMQGNPSPLSRADNTMAKKLLGIIKQKNLDWGHMSDKAKDLFISKYTGAHGRG